MPDSLQIQLVPCLSDNYAVLLHDDTSRETALVDAPEAEPIAAALRERGWQLTHILITHGHGDHVAGIEALKSASGARVFGPEAEAERIPGLDEAVREGSEIRFAGMDVLVIDTPGHTRGHVTYWMPDQALAFAGDTLFVMGCGRILEGTPETMWRSLVKLSELPPATRVYCGHEYTRANAHFALTVDGANQALKERAELVETLRTDGLPTVPTTIGEELRTNPFLRATDPAVARAVGREGRPAWEVFAEIRARKDRF
jgi:hydroxyacylglutathione hydrolase